jgi:hypothetical protein
MHDAIGTALMCVIAASTLQRAKFMIGVTAVAVALIYYGLGYVQPELTAAAILGVFVGSRFRLHFSVAVSCCLFLVGLLADAVDPIAFGTIKPAHIPLLPRALIHGSPAAMMHIGVLILLVTPVARRFRSVYSSCRS